GHPRVPDHAHHRARRGRFAHRHRRQVVRAAHGGHQLHAALQPLGAAGDLGAVDDFEGGRADLHPARGPARRRLAGPVRRAAPGIHGPVLALDLFVNGLIFGLFYALMAVGLAMIFGVLKVVNFAHGEFYMVGAYTYVLCALKLGAPPWLALPLAALAGAALGALVERTLMRPLYAGYASW